MKQRNRDFLLIAGVLLLAVGIYIVQNRIGQKQGTEVIVTIDGKEYGTYSLATSQTIAMGEHNLLYIYDGCADMIDADCPDQLCVKQKPISGPGETIICLPNKVVVKVLGEKQEDEPDVVVQ